MDSQVEWLRNHNVNVNDSNIKELKKVLSNYYK